MDRKSNCAVIDKFKDLYGEGYRCINYETDKNSNLFTVYLKDFERENTKTLKCSVEEGTVLKNYIDELSQ